MTIFGAIIAAIVRKAKAFLAECRTLVGEAKAVEQKIVSTAKADVSAIIAKAKAEEKAVVEKTKTEVEILRNDLIEKISKI